LGIVNSLSSISNGFIYLFMQKGEYNMLCIKIMYMVFIKCLQALEKISRDQPLPCLQAGAIMAVLSFVDFFSTSVQVSEYTILIKWHLLSSFFPFIYFGSICILLWCGGMNINLLFFWSLSESCTFNCGEHMQETAIRKFFTIHGGCSEIMQSSTI